MSRAVLSLILGILSLICCPLTGPVAWYIGNQELNAMKTGAASQDEKGLATVGMVLGIIGSIMLAFSLVWVLFFGGMAVLQGLSGR